MHILILAKIVTVFSHYFDIFHRTVLARSINNIVVCLHAKIQVLSVFNKTRISLIISLFYLEKLVHAFEKHLTATTA